MKEYYVHGYLLDLTNSAGGLWVTAWQHVAQGAQVGFVTEVQLPDGSYEPVSDVPAVHEFIPTSKDEHFAPGMLRDGDELPKAGRSMAEIVAELKAALAVKP